jgi:hypothetical protein
MLEDFTLDTFSGRIGERFAIRLESGEELEAELVEANALGAADAEPRVARAPFSIVFRGPSDPVLPQRIYRFAHAELGDFELFVVPIGRDDSGTSYEAVFT